MILDQRVVNIPELVSRFCKFYQIPSCPLCKSEDDSKPPDEIKAMQDCKNILEKGVMLDSLFLILNMLPT